MAKYLVTNSEPEAQAFLARMDSDFGYPNGNAQRYGDIIRPVSGPLVAVIVEDRCVLTTVEKSKIASALPSPFTPTNTPQAL